MMQPMICAECGAEFTPKPRSGPNTKYCSQRCARNAQAHRAKSKYHATHDFAAAWKQSRPTPLAELTKAIRKPANTSAVRWRIELRRRANSRYYAEYGENLSH